MYIEPDKELRKLGYRPMFACRESMTEAAEYVADMAKASGAINPASVVIAAEVYLNTYIKIMYDNGHLTTNNDEEKVA